MAGKVYFITGANKGIGFEIAKQLTEDPSNTVIGSTRDDSRSSELIALSKTASNLKIVKLDVGEQSSIDKLASQLTEVAADGIDVFISNAGIYDDSIFNKALETDRAAWVKHFEVNSIGPLFVLKAIFPFLEKKSTKQVILVSSISGQISDRLASENSAYGTSKVALNYIGRTLSDELKDYTVVALHPGVVSSDRANEAFALLLKRTPEIQELFDSVVLITPKESAESIIKLVKGLTPSDGNKFYNYDGTILTW